ncbi:hypothetical protein [Mycobacterium canetti]|uniref:hypothetical protein n=1 Tax=Mycobacterium canetti TaxID=78331 RepID=UPI00059B2D22|nr:hypothetical protein [Mycobacterium canetti]
MAFGFSEVGSDEVEAGCLSVAAGSCDELARRHHILPDPRVGAGVAAALLAVRLQAHTSIGGHGYRLVEIS